MRYFLRIFNLELNSKIYIGNFLFVPHEDNRQKIQESERDGKVRYTANAIRECEQISDIRNIPSGLIDPIHNELYKIVSLLSFFQGRHINWYGEGVKTNGEFEILSYMSTYIRNPKEVSKIYFRDDVVEHVINHALKYLELQRREYVDIFWSSLWHFLNAGIIRKDVPIYQKFLVVWICFEQLVQSYWRIQNEDNIVDINKFVEVKKKIKSSLSQILKQESYNNSQRDFVYRKLDELNRIPFIVKSKWFFEEYLNLKTVPLNFIKKTLEIRHRLFHLGRINNYIKLNEKRFYLKNILERVFLGLINYRNDYFYSDWKCWGRQNFTKLQD